MKPVKPLLILLLALHFSLTLAQKGWKEGQMEVMIRVTSARDIEFLERNRIDFEAAAPDGSRVYAYPTPGELDLIKDQHLDFSILVPDLNSFHGRNGDRMVPPGYYTYEDIVAIADSLSTAFPNICLKVMYGTSVGNRQLAALKISDNVSLDENEAEILFDGGIHGDEVGGPENVIRFARDIVLAYGTDPSITDLINTREIWLFYMVNPDGRVTMSRYNGNGVDCNRDAGYMWNAEGFSTGAFSQPESRALRQCMLENQFVIYTNLHSGTEVISYPWSYRGDPCPDNFNHNVLAGIYSSSAGYSPPLGYGQGFIIMYAINGSYKDFQYGSLGNMGWSIEISNLKQPPSSQIMTYYNYNKPAMLEMINRAGFGIQGTVTDSLTGDPLPAVVWINNLYPASNDPVVGDFHRYLAPGVPVNVTVTANGYKSKTVNGVTIPTTGAATVNFELTADTGRYACKVLSCQIPNNNFADPGFTPGAVGMPDNTAYALGRNGWIVLDMGDTIVNEAGPDFTVFEAGAMMRGYTVYAGTSPDGPWVTVGTGTGTATFDLASTFLSQARYIKVKDDGDGPFSGYGIGFNLDAVQNLHPVLVTDFIAAVTEPCTGSPVSFYDLSSGTPVSWHWRFPGGIPASSAQQNPPGVIYNTPGAYDVTLTVSNGFSVASLTRKAYITPVTLPSAPFKPIGPTEVFQNDTNWYTTGGSSMASSYVWILDPAGAGTVSGSDTIATVIWDSAYLGTASLKVAGINTCGTGIYSDTLQVTVFPSLSNRTNSAGPPIDLVLYPNPASFSIKASTRNLRNGHLTILSPEGRNLCTLNIKDEDETFILDLSGYPKGLYFVLVSNGERILVKKLLVN